MEIDKRPLPLLEEDLVQPIIEKEEDTFEMVRKNKQIDFIFTTCYNQAKEIIQELYSINDIHNYQRMSGKNNQWTK